jgi:probable phosphoglycerate mutase
MALRLYLLRHGQTAMSRANLFCGRRLNPPLTAEGAAMAEAFANAYATTRWQGIYSSPLDRARATAEPLAARTRVAVETMDGLAELD